MYLDCLFSHSRSDRVLSSSPLLNNPRRNEIFRNPFCDSYAEVTRRLKRTICESSIVSSTCENYCSLLLDVTLVARQMQITSSSSARPLLLDVESSVQDGSSPPRRAILDVFIIIKKLSHTPLSFFLSKI